eukprot:TRINITY_DN11969_c0_g1_i1.p2 TRINITY_DN11969_c0_g1~~TRINITY_DN11969_c0_g1_i1.p2  ORF type:complete len:128 (-),score=2.54 TRINITY_DN11969_c0_g1_i1:127-510(-)
MINEIYGFYVKPLLEIGVLTMLIYGLLYYIRGTRGTYILAGMVIILIGLTVLSEWWNFEVISWLLANCRGRKRKKETGQKQSGDTGIPQHTYQVQVKNQKSKRKEGMLQKEREIQDTKLYNLSLIHI